MVKCYDSNGNPCHFDKATECVSDKVQQINFWLFLLTECEPCPYKVGRGQGGFDKLSNGDGYEYHLHINRGAVGSKRTVTLSW